MVLALFKQIICSDIFISQLLFDIVRHISDIKVFDISVELINLSKNIFDGLSHILIFLNI